MSEPKKTIAVLGGTGALGGGLAWRWAKAGYPIVIGSRSAEKAQKAAEELTGSLAEAGNTPAPITGASNEDAASQADVIVVAVPYSAQQANMEAIRDEAKGKVVIDCTVPLKPPKVARVQLPAAGCAAVEAQSILGDGVDLVTAFHNVGAEHLRSDHVVDCDVLVFGDKVAARDVCVELVEAAGMKAWHAGPLDNSAAGEALTSVLIGINKRYGIRGSGIRITGAPTK